MRALVFIGAFGVYVRVAIYRRVLVFAHVEDVGCGPELAQADGGHGNDGVYTRTVLISARYLHALDVHVVCASCYL